MIDKKHVIGVWKRYSTANRGAGVRFMSNLKVQMRIHSVDAVEVRHWVVCSWLTGTLKNDKVVMSRLKDLEWYFKTRGQAEHQMATLALLIVEFTEKYKIPEARNGDILNKNHGKS